MQVQEQRLGKAGSPPSLAPCVPRKARKMSQIQQEASLSLQHVLEASGNSLRFLCKTGSSLPLSIPTLCSFGPNPQPPRCLVDGATLKADFNVWVGFGEPEMPPPITAPLTPFAAAPAPPVPTPPHPQAGNPGVPLLPAARRPQVQVCQESARVGVGGVSQEGTQQGSPPSAHLTSRRSEAIVPRERKLFLRRRPSWFSGDDWEMSLDHCAGIRGPWAVPSGDPK